MISAVVLVRNQQHQLEDCLKSLGFCEEIIVVDDYSQDSSVKTAEKFGAKVYKHRLNGNFAAQRNWAMAKAKNDWILFVDADEVVSDELATELYQMTAQFLTGLSGFYLRRKDYLYKRELRFGDSGKVNILRLGRRSRGQWRGKVHEVWELRGDIGRLKKPILHYPHPTVAEFLSEVNFYTTLRAQELHDQKKSASFFSILVYPTTKFVVNYLIKLGFLDGTLGMISALMMSLHSFLVRSKLWQLSHKKVIYEFGN